MDMELIKSFETIALFVLFVALIYLVYLKTDDHTFDEVANLPFVGDDTTNKIEQKHDEGDDHE